MEKIKLEKNEILVLRSCKKGMKSYGGFIWPKEGFVEAKDWKPTYKCGNGLHGLPWGVGGNYLNHTNDAIWLLVKVNTSKNYLTGRGELADKCKFKNGIVVFTGNKFDCLNVLSKYLPDNIPANWLTQTAGYKSTQKAGYESTQTAGYKSTQKAGDGSTQTAGHGSTQTAGDMSTQKAGKNSVQISCYYENGVYKVACRVVTKKEANKTYYVKQGVWTEIK